MHHKFATQILAKNTIETHATMKLNIMKNQAKNHLIKELISAHEIKDSPLTSGLAT